MQLVRNRPPHPGRGANRARAPLGKRDRHRAARRIARSCAAGGGGSTPSCS
jgi:hypothetical protein